MNLLPSLLGSTARRSCNPAQWRGRGSEAEIDLQVWKASETVDPPSGNFQPRGLEDPGEWRELVGEFAVRTRTRRRWEGNILSTVSDRSLG